MHRLTPGPVWNAITDGIVPKALREVKVAPTPISKQRNEHIQQMLVEAARCRVRLPMSHHPGGGSENASISGTHSNAVAGPNSH